MSYSIRKESPGDEAEIRDVVREAFPTDMEARLVDALRKSADPFISLVAVSDDGSIVGHILFTQVDIISEGDTRHAIGLGPMAVRPVLQRRGIGSALVREGLDVCRRRGDGAVVLVGHPSYYPRFGFQLAWDYGLYYEKPGPFPAFFAMELVPGALSGGGEVRYHSAFSEFG